jgi:hypothetical protein
MFEPKLVEAIGAEPLQLIAVEDLYKGQLALFADRAVWVEERLGVYAVRGVYPFSAASNVELRDGFLGKELSLTIEGKTVCFRRLLADDAQTLCARFGGTTQAPLAAPAQEETMPPPSHPQQREPKAQKKQNQTRPPKQARSPDTRSLKERLRTLVKPALLVAAVSLLSRFLPHSLSAPAYWLAFSTFGAWGKPKRYPLYFRYGVGAAAISAAFQFAQSINAWQHPGLGLLLCYCVITLGAFAALPGSFDKPKVAGLGAALGCIDLFFLSGTFGDGDPESLIGSFVAFMLLWTVLGIIEQEPELQRHLRPR